MDEAATTWALVVGINQYDDATTCRPLTGAVADAVATVSWLRKIGVPDAQILLHASPSTPESQAALAGLGLPWQTATEPVIWSSIVTLAQAGEQGRGSRLFVFLSGHGLYEPTTGPLFLTQEASALGGITNLGLNKYCQFFRSLRFQRQFLFVDGCQNYPYAETALPTVEPALHSGVAPRVPRPENSLFACFAASQSQVAREVDGRGALLQMLLPALDPDTPAYPDAVKLDFVTGARHLDLHALYFDYVQATVQALVQDRYRGQQRPRAQAHGAGEALGEWPLIRLPDVPLSQVELSVEPPEAIQDVQRVSIEVDDPPWELRLPRPPARTVTLPLVSRVPKGLSATATCRVQPTSPWDVVQGKRELSTETDQKVTFQLSPRGTLPTFRHLLSPVPKVDRFSVKFREPSGGPHFSSPDFYPTAAQQLGMPRRPRSGDVVGDGVTIFLHEDGPDFEIQPDRVSQGISIVEAWADAARQVLPSSVSIETILRGTAALPATASVRLVLPRGGARRLAGPLARMPAVTVESSDQPYLESVWRRGDGYALDSVERSPVIQVEPGTVRVRLDLPWGSWTQRVRAHASAEEPVTLPTTVGVPPLRVALVGELRTRGAGMLGVAGRPPTGYLRAGLGSKRRVSLQETEPGSAAWCLIPPASARLPQRRSWLATLENPPSSDRPDSPIGAARTTFPICAGVPLGVDLTPGAERIEPLSNIEAPEWDLLVSTGLLDALTVQDVLRLAEQKWFDPLLWLAGAYAVYAARSWTYLALVVDTLTRLSPHSLDVHLLRIAVGEQVNARLSSDAVADLARLAKRDEVPVFRWGIGLALDLLGRADDAPHLREWREALERIRQALSPTSIWSAWTEAVPGG